MTTETVRSGDLDLAVEVSAGSGAPILFIHGNSASASTWRSQLDGELGDAHRCVAVSLPGHGASGRADGVEGYSLPRYAQCVADVAEALCDTPPVLVGWSLGGHIALEALTLIPDVPGVAIFGTPPVAIPPDIEAAFLPHPAMGVSFAETVTEDEAAAYAQAFLAPDSTFDSSVFVPDILATDGNARLGLLTSMGGGAYTDEVQIVAEMRQPLAILHGAGEQLVSLPYLEELEAPTLWTGAVRQISGAGHAPHVETPDEFGRLIAEFVASLG